MYEVYVFQDNTEFPLLDVQDQECQLLEAKLELGVNKSGQFTFRIHDSHPYRSKIKEMACEICIYEKGRLVYKGRPILAESDFHEITKFVCEGELGYLLDSLHPPFEYEGDITTFFSNVLTQHNQQVEDWKRFEVGRVTVSNTTNHISYASGYHLTTLENLTAVLLDTLGGYMCIRRENGKRFLDYIADYEHINTQLIAFSENVIDLNTYTETENLVTAVIPLGAETEVEGINGIMKRITISSVNNGLPYLVDEEARKKHGWICKIIEFDDETIPVNLKQRGQEYLDINKKLYTSLEFTALDLSVIDVEVEKMNVGDRVHVVSEPNHIDDYFMIENLSKNLLDPTDTVIMLGKTIDTFTREVTTTQYQIGALIRQSKDIQQGVIHSMNQEMLNIHEAITKMEHEIQGISKSVILFTGALLVGESHVLNSLGFQKLQLYMQIQNERQLVTMDISSGQSQTTFTIPLSDMENVSIGSFTVHENVFTFSRLQIRNWNSGEISIPQGTNYYIYRIEGIY